MELPRGSGRERRHAHGGEQVVRSPQLPSGRLAAALAAEPFFESAPDETAFARAYPGATGTRVTGLWNRYDPDGILCPAP
ncbi:hypothetical protein ACFVUY_28830 [Kitasatospora sp. NPDC058063]|uniref:hypothetical protein n=1 Tax=unclassified Kitasatospora TaxID=2633591 RepID=UPI0036DD7CF0